VLIRCAELPKGAESALCGNPVNQQQLSRAVCWFTLFSFLARPSQFRWDALSIGLFKCLYVTCHLSDCGKWSIAVLLFAPYPNLDQNENLCAHQRPQIINAWSCSEQPLPTDRSHFPYRISSLHSFANSIIRI